MSEQKVIEVPYKPKPKQQLFHNHPAWIKLFGGAMGGGKSKALAAECLKLLIKYPGNRGYIGREDLTDFKKTTLISIEETFPPELIEQWHRTENWIKLLPMPGPDGVVRQSLLYYGELKDSESLKSLNLGFFAIDEATEVAEESYLMLLSRLRLPQDQVPDIKYYALLASNPEPGWVKKTFIEGSIETAPDVWEKGGDTVFVRSLPQDNDALPPDYVAKLRSKYPEEWVKRYLEGSWDAAEGQIFKEFDRTRHIIRPRPIGNTWEKLFALDHGVVNPTAVEWAAIDQDGVMYIYDEHYASQMLISQHAKAILDRGNTGQYSMMLVDPSAGAKNRERNDGIFWSVVDEYREYGIQLIGADNDVLSSINRINEAFKADKLFIFENCTNLIQEIPNYMWEKIRPWQVGNRDNPEKPRKVNDHGIDCLRYLLNARPPGPGIAPPPPKGLSWIERGPESQRTAGSNPISRPNMSIL